MSSDGTEASAFELLHPAVQYHVVNSLGWPGLRPLQEQAVAPLVQGQVVVNAGFHGAGDLAEGVDGAGGHGTVATAPLSL